MSALSSASASGRQRLLMDAGWRFHRGEIAGSSNQLQGVGVEHWRWTPGVGESEAAAMADPNLQTTGSEWKDAKTGQDVFSGRVGFAWFRAVLPERPKPAQILHFEGVDDNATVYLNGQKLAVHQGWDDPFDVDLKAAWKKGGPNVLAVLVENTAGMGGITGPVLFSRWRFVCRQRGGSAQL